MDEDEVWRWENLFFAEFQSHLGPRAWMKHREYGLNMKNLLLVMSKTRDESDRIRGQSLRRNWSELRNNYAGRVLGRHRAWNRVSSPTPWMAPYTDTEYGPGPRPHNDDTDQWCSADHRIGVSDSNWHIHTFHCLNNCQWNRILDPWTNTISPMRVRKMYILHWYRYLARHL